MSAFLSAPDQTFPQEYTFKVQVPGKSSSDALLTIGKANIDMARFAGDDGSSQNAMVPIAFKVGGTSTGYLKLVVIATPYSGLAGSDVGTEVHAPAWGGT